MIDHLQVDMWPEHAQAQLDGRAIALYWTTMCMCAGEQFDGGRLLVYRPTIYR